MLMKLINELPSVFILPITEVPKGKEVLFPFSFIKPEGQSKEKIFTKHLSSYM